MPCEEFYGSDFEYRIYARQVTQIGEALLEFALTNGDRKIRSSRNVIDELEITSILQMFGINPHDLGIPAEFQLPRIDVESIERAEIEVFGRNIGINVRIKFRSDYEITFPNNPLDVVFLPEENRLRITVRLQKIRLLNSSIEADPDYLPEVSLNISGSEVSGVTFTSELELTSSLESYTLDNNELAQFEALKVRAETLDVNVTDVNVRVTNFPNWAEGIFENPVRKGIRKLANTLKEAIWDNSPKLDYPNRYTCGPPFTEEESEYIHFFNEPDIKIKADHIIIGNPGSWGCYFEPMASSESQAFSKNYWSGRLNIKNIKPLFGNAFFQSNPIAFIDTHNYPLNLDKKKLDSIKTSIYKYGHPDEQELYVTLMEFFEIGLHPIALREIRWKDIDFKKQSISYAMPPDRQKTTIKLPKSLEKKLADKRRESGAKNEDFVLDTYAGRGMAPVSTVRTMAQYIRFDDLVDIVRLPPELYKTYCYDNAPLPDTTPSLTELVGYATNYVIPNTQYSFVHARGSFSFKSDTHYGREYVAYLSTLPQDKIVKYEITSPPAPPTGDFFTRSFAELMIDDLELKLLLDEVVSHLRIHARLKLILKFGIVPKCIQGREDFLLELVRGLKCLSQFNGINIGWNFDYALVELLFPDFIFLRVDDSDEARPRVDITIEQQGDLPTSDVTELAEFVQYLVHQAYKELMPIPFMFDIFRAAKTKTVTRYWTECGWLNIIGDMGWPL